MDQQLIIRRRSLSPLSASSLFESSQGSLFKFGLRLLLSWHSALSSWISLPETKIYYSSSYWSFLPFLAQVWILDLLCNLAIYSWQRAWILDQFISQQDQNSTVNTFEPKTLTSCSSYSSVFLFMISMHGPSSRSNAIVSRTVNEKNFTFYKKGK